MKTIKVLTFVVVMIFSFFPICSFSQETVNLDEKAKDLEEFNSSIEFDKVDSDVALIDASEVQKEDLNKLYRKEDISYILLKFSALPLYTGVGVQYYVKYGLFLGATIGAGFPYDPTGERYGTMSTNYQAILMADVSFGYTFFSRKKHELAVLTELSLGFASNDYIITPRIGFRWVGWDIFYIDIGVGYTAIGYETGIQPWTTVGFRLKT